MTLNVAILGCGNMGSFIANAIMRGEAGDVRLKTIIGTSRKIDHLKEIAKRADCKWITDPRNLELGKVDLIIEAAGQQSVKEYMIPFLEKGKHIMLISVGALSEKGVFEKLHSLSKTSDSQVILPTGAIGGLDAIRSAALGGLESVELMTKKPPYALENAPYIIQNGLDLTNLENDYEIFNGNAIEAAKAFPANLNVAVALSLAGIGPEHTTVKIVASPKIKRNTHEIRVVGACGEFNFKFENMASPQNPKTSHLATLSVLNALKEFNSAIKGIAL